MRITIAIFFLEATVVGLKNFYTILHVGLEPGAYNVYLYPPHPRT